MGAGDLCLAAANETKEKSFGHRGKRKEKKNISCSKKEKSNSIGEAMQGTNQDLHKHCSRRNNTDSFFIIRSQVKIEREQERDARYFRRKEERKRQREREAVREGDIERETVRERVRERQ